MIGGVTRYMLPHLPGVPHLHVNGPLKFRRERARTSGEAGPARKVCLITFSSFPPRRHRSFLARALSNKAAVPQKLRRLDSGLETIDLH